MKILYLYSNLTTVGGADRILIQKANYFAEVYSYDVYIITDSQTGRPTTFPLSPKVYHIDLGLDFNKQYKHGAFMRCYYYFTQMNKYKRMITSHLKQIKPDIVISTLGRELDFLTNIKDDSIKVGESHIAKSFCRNFHLMEKKGFPYKQVAQYWRKKQENAVKKLNALVVLTQFDANSWHCIKKAHIIPNSYPFYPKQVNQYNQKIIISVGRLNEQKGYTRLVEAWTRVSTKHSDWKLYIYGNGEEKELLELLIEKNNIKQSLILCSPVSNIKEKYLESSIYVMSSCFEGFPMVLLEAMACGLPCIAFDCPHGPSDLITNGENGILVENNNIEKLTEAICYLIENEEKRLCMGLNARIQIQTYSPEVVMKQWDNLFKTLITSRK